eukprot:scaffold407_cov130-Isochrysis_galbana.AAC.2
MEPLCLLASEGSYSATTGVQRANGVSHRSKGGSTKATSTSTLPSSLNKPYILSARRQCAPSSRSRTARTLISPATARAVGRLRGRGMIALGLGVATVGNGGEYKEPLPARHKVLTPSSRVA